MRPLLSICIPTFNRGPMVEKLVRHLLAIDGPFEICVEVDGGTDDSLSRLQPLASHRCSVGFAPNAGRAAALHRAVDASHGQFVMLFDDDDWLDHEGLQDVLRDCAASLPHGVIGYIYHLADADGLRVGSPFPKGQSNLLRLRADEKVTGDKKEVVVGDLLKAAMRGRDGLHRRIPTSLFWARLALQGDVICRDLVIGRKTYRVGGMSDTIDRLKRANSVPMVWLHAARLRGFVRGKYRSMTYAAKSFVALLAYGLLAANEGIAGLRR